MRVRQNVRDAHHAHSEAQLGQHLTPLTMVPIGQGLSPAHHETIEHLGKEKAKTGLGRDVFYEEHASRDEQGGEALENAALVGPRKVMHHVEHVSGVERAFEPRVSHVAFDEGVTQTEVLTEGPREPDSARARVNAHDPPPGLGLPEVRREETKPAADVENSTLFT
jgi:hypothetical protein